jgi:hypothetical protein
VSSDEQRRADELDRLIENPAAGATGSEGLGPLVALAADLRASAPAPAASSVRSRVAARVARGIAAGQSFRRPVWRLGFRPASALASFLLVFLMAVGGTTAYASEAALPGDILYGVKRGLEGVQLRLSTTAMGDSVLIERFADRRVEEIESLTARGRWADVAEALQAYPAIIDEMVAASQPNALDSQAARLSHHLEVLTRVGANTPPQAQPALLRALEHADRGRREVERQRHEPKPVPPGQIEADDDSDRGPKKTPPGQERKHDGED